MGNLDLTPSDEAVLRALASEPATADDLVAVADYERDELEVRLVAMADNGLVRERESGRYELADSGHRVLESPGDGTADSRIDVPDAVEDAIAAMDLRQDREEALVNVVAFLRYWGEATASEVIDAIYSENPAGYDAPDEWWSAFVRDRLAALPDVEPPDEGEVWRYEGRPGVADETADGRTGFAVDADQTYGSVKHALESLDVEPSVRAAARDAFALLLRRGEARADELRADLDAEPPETDDSREEWWVAELRPVFEALPGVERTDADEETWRYAETVGVDESDERTDRDAADERAALAEADERTGVDETDARSGLDEDAASASAADDRCPVCGEPYSGRVYLETSETVLPGRPARTCVRATPGADGDAALTLYYHRRAGG